MKRRHPSICALVSGGLDSAFMLHTLRRVGRQLVPLYLRCGLRWEPTELYWLRRYLRVARIPGLASLQVVTLPLRSVYGAHWSLAGQGIVPGAGTRDAAVYLPGRNVFLLSVAAIVCARQKISTLALGVLKANPFGDGSPRFLSQLAACLRQALGKPIRVLAPLSARSKTQVIRDAKGLPLELTFSCLAPRGRRHCGGCNKCAERKRAFHMARVLDPTLYAW